jgi:hypothetical protein
MTAPTPDVMALLIARMDRFDASQGTTHAMLEGLSRQIERQSLQRDLRCERHTNTIDRHDERLTALETAQDEQRKASNDWRAKLRELMAGTALAVAGGWIATHFFSVK